MFVLCSNILLLLNSFFNIFPIILFRNHSKKSMRSVVNFLGDIESSYRTLFSESSYFLSTSISIGWAAFSLIPTCIVHRFKFITDFNWIDTLLKSNDFLWLSDVRLQNSFLLWYCNSNFDVNCLSRLIHLKNIYLHVFSHLHFKFNFRWLLLLACRLAKPTVLCLKTLFQFLRLF